MSRYPYTLLYVEDEPAIMQAYTRLFAPMFQKVVCARDGAEGYEKYKKEAPDIVLSDIVTPKTDGLQMAKFIRQFDMRTRIVLLTAHLDRDYLFRAANLDITNYLVKPVRKVELIEALHKAIRQLRMIDHTDLKEQSEREALARLLQTSTPETLLTPNENALLTILLSDPNRYFSLEQIIQAFWERYDKKMSPNAVKSLLKRLRHKFPDLPIANRYGYGYRLAVSAV